MKKDNPTKVYIASDYAKHGVAKAVAIWLRHNGYEVTSTWHDLPYQNIYIPTYPDTKQLKEWANKDRVEVESSDALLLLPSVSKIRQGRNYYSGAKFVEAGIALGRSIPVFIVASEGGYRKGEEREAIENLLLYSDGVYVFTDMYEMSKNLASL